MTVWFGHWPVLSNLFFFSSAADKPVFKSCRVIAGLKGSRAGEVSLSILAHRWVGRKKSSDRMFEQAARIWRLWTLKDVRKEGNVVLKGVKSLNWAMETVDLNVRVYLLIVIFVKLLDNPKGKWWKSCTWRCFSNWVLMKAAENTYLHKNPVELDNLKVFFHL